MGEGSVGFHLLKLLGGGVMSAARFENGFPRDPCGSRRSTHPRQRPLGVSRVPAEQATRIVARQAAVVCAVVGLAAIAVTGQAAAGTHAFYVADPVAGTATLGALFSLDDVGNRSQVQDDYAANFSPFPRNLGQLYRVDPVTGVRTLVSDFYNSAQGPPIEPTARESGRAIGGLAVVNDAVPPFILMSGFGFKGSPVLGPTSKFPAVFKIDPTTGARSLFSDFRDSAQGPLGFAPSGIAVFTLPSTPDELFVANAYANSITVYDLTASGDTTPARSVSGASTHLDFPVALALDTSAKQLFVANVPDPPALDSITVYSLSASGDVAPLRTLSGANTGLSAPAGIVVDRANNELLVANAGNNSITVYDLSASGDTIPTRILAGATTGLAFGDEVPVGLALDLTHDELFVTNFSGARASVFARTAGGNTAPLRNLGGPATQIIGPTGLALDVANDELFVVNPGNDTVLVFSRTATANTAPLRTLAGSSTELGAPQNPALDGATNELFVPNARDNSVTVYARTASGNTVPLRALSGPATELAAPLAVAIGH